jgi:hypothetical protein
MKKLNALVKERFDYDVEALAPYTDAQSTQMLTDLVYASGLTSRISVMEGVKGSEEIKVLTSDPALQAAASCGWTPSGGVILTNETLATKRVKIQEDYCNEDLNGTWAQLMNAAGANAQDTEAPFADIMAAYYIKKAAKKNQDLMLNGDTGSLNPDLAHYDGYVKLWDNDGDLVDANSLETSITSANALDIALTVYEAIPSVLFDNDVTVEIICGRETFRKIIAQNFADNKFNFPITEEAGSEPSFILPTTNVRVRAYSQLNGTEKMYAVPYNYMFFGTDLSSDYEGFEFKYDDTDEKLRFGVKWRSGVNYVFPEYFVKLVLAEA